MVWAKRGGSKSKNGNSKKRKKGRKSKLSEESKNKVAELYISGYSVREISEFFEVSEMTVYRVVNKYLKDNFSADSFDEVFEKVKAKVWN